MRPYEEEEEGRDECELETVQAGDLPREPVILREKNKIKGRRPKW